MLVRFLVGKAQLKRVLVHAGVVVVPLVVPGVGRSWNDVQAAVLRRLQPGITTFLSRRSD